MARPKKRDGERLTEQLKCLVTPGEFALVCQHAAAAGLSLSGFVRRRALALPVQPPAARVDSALINELNRIGVNLNQLTRDFNAAREHHGGDWRAIEAELRRVLELVVRSCAA